MDEREWEQLLHQAGDERSTGVPGEADHVGPELLADYLDLLLEPTTRARVDAHLNGCEVCRTVLVELQQPLPFDTDAPVSRERKAAWNAMLANRDAPAAPERSATPRRDPNPVKTAFLPWLVAAAAVFVAGLSWVVRPSPGTGQVRAPAPIADAPILALAPLSESTRGDSDAIASNTKPMTLALTFAETSAATGFSLTLQPSAGPILWQMPARRDANGMFSVAIPAGYLSPGDYEVALRGDGEILARYRFKVADGD